MNPLARAVYNIVAEGGDDVLRAAGRVAKKIDPRTAKEAIKRVADDVVEAADRTPKMLSQPVGYRARETGKGWQPLREHIRLENERGNKLFDTYKDYADDGYEVTWVAHTPEDAGAYTLSAKDIDAWKAGKLDVDLSDIDEVDLGGATLVGRDDEGGYLYIRRLAGSDDWGWKGGRPGEVTAGSLKYDYPDLIALGKQLSQNPEKPLAKIAMSETVEGGVKRPRQEWEIGASVIDELKALEEADVPREWTGKVAAAAYNMLKGRDNQRAMRLLENPRDFYAYKQLPERLSRAMRPMTNDQRETFLALLPEWTESLDDLVNAVKTF
jgi:hypothetical protein